MAEQHRSPRQPLVRGRTAQYQVHLLVMPRAPGETGTLMGTEKEKTITLMSRDENEISRRMKPNAKKWEGDRGLGGGV